MAGNLPSYRVSTKHFTYTRAIMLSFIGDYQMAKNTLADFDAAIATFNGASKAIQGGNAERKAATRNLFVKAAVHFAAVRTFTADDAMARIYGEKLPSGRALIQRRSDWNTVRAAAHKAGAAKVETIYTDDTPRQKFLQLCAFVRDNPKASDDQIAEARKAKVETPSNDTAGDLIERMVKLAKTLATDHRDTAKAIAPHLVAIQNYFNAERGVGRLRFMRELDQKAPKGGVDLAQLLAA